MSNITIRDDSGHEHFFAVSNNIAHAILELLSALEPSRGALPSKHHTSLSESADRPTYKV